MRDKIRLGDLCTVVSGTTPKTGNEEYWDGDILWVTPAELTDETFIINDTARKITKKAVKDSSLKPFPKGTVLLSSRAPIGKVAIAGQEMYCNQGFKNFICNERLNNEYLYWFLKGKKDFLNSLGRGATFKEVSKSIVENIEIPLLDIVEQKHIASLMNTCQSLITLKNQQLNELDNLIKSRFVEIFGDEHNSKNWDITAIDDVADVRVGVVITPAKYYTDEQSGVRAFRSLNVGEMKVNDRDWVYFNKVGNEKNNRSILKENDVLIVRSGAPGKSCVVTKEYEGCNAIDVIIAHADESKVNPYYLSCFTNFSHGKKQILEGTGGAAQQHFNIGKYKLMRLMLPPIDLQNEYCRFLGHVDKLKVEVQKSLDESQLLFDSLMQKYFE